MDIKNVLKEHYNLKLNSEPVIIRAGKGRTVYKITTKDKVYALKVHTRRRELDAELALLNQLKSNGFHSFPKLISTVDGLGYVELEGAKFVLNEWIKGGKPSFSDVRELKTASAFLAKFHQAACAPNAETLQNAANKFLKPITFNEVRMGQLKNATIYNLLREWERSFGTEVLKFAIERMEYAQSIFPLDGYKELLTSERKENTFTHGDYNTSNVILTPRRKMYLIDFDGICYYMRISDLLFLCHLHMGEKAERLLDILKSYHRQRPLSRTEFDIIKALLIVPGKIYWEVRMKTYSSLDIDKNWIGQKLTPYVSIETFNRINQLSYSDIV